MSGAWEWLCWGIFGRCPLLGFLTSVGYFFIGSTSECPGYACGCLGPYEKVRVDQSLVDVLVFLLDSMGVICRCWDPWGGLRWGIFAVWLLLGLRHPWAGCLWEALGSGLMFFRALKIKHCFCPVPAWSILCLPDLFVSPFQKFYILRLLFARREASFFLPYSLQPVMVPG